MHCLSNCRLWPTLSLIVLTVLWGDAQAAEPAGLRAGEAQRILMFTKTNGFRHGSIPTALSAIRTAAEQAGFAVDDSEDGGLFNTADLAQYSAVVFLMTTGNVLNDTQQAAFEDYIRAGNGYVGVHSATDTEYDWPWYGELVGAYFNNHPSIQQATINIEDAAHPSTAGVDDPWVRTDEWYNFQTNPRGNVNVLASIDESTYSGGNMGDHPIAWYHDFDGGRSWYTAGGHTNASYGDPMFIGHILGGLTYAAGEAPGADGDSDGVPDSSDNCSLLANPDQIDTDNDGFGNRCDPDLNNDLTVDFVDLGLIKAVFFGSDPDADFDSSGSVDFVDLGVMKAFFFAAPGPGAVVR